MQFKFLSQKNFVHSDYNQFSCQDIIVFFIIHDGTGYKFSQNLRISNKLVIKSFSSWKKTTAVAIYYLIKANNVHIDIGPYELYEKKSSFTHGLTDKINIHVHYFFVFISWYSTNV